MTPIESIYEIQAAVLDFQRYLKGKKSAAYYRAYERYEKLVNRFFKENVNMVKTKKHNTCLNDVDCFLKLLEETAEDYQLE